MMSLLLFIKNNPYIFTMLILVLYALNILAGLVTKDWLHAWYWWAAFNITLCVLFMQRGAHA